MAESLPLPVVTIPVSCLDDSVRAEPPPAHLSETVAARTSSDDQHVLVELNDECVRSTSSVEVNRDGHTDHSRDGNSDTLQAAASCNSVIAGTSLSGSQPVYSSPPGAVMMNRRLVLKQLPSGQFTLTVQSLEPSDLGESSVVIADSQSIDTSTCSVTVESCSESGMPNSHRLLAMSDVGVGGVEVPELCVDGSPVCLVCGDKGSGFHYSVFSCEGCKGFFKRTVQRNMVYSCKENGVCDINRVTRNNCQHCRFRRCLDAGMKKEAVREDRTPGGKHRAKKLRADEADVSTTSVGSAALINWNGCEEDEQLLSRLVNSRPEAVNTVEDIRGITSSTGQVVVKEFMQLIYLELRCIIEWAKKVPGFLDLVSEDQMALLKSSFMELSVLRLSYRSLDCVGSVRFSNSLVMSAGQCRNLGWGDDFVTSTFEFISRLRTIAIDSTEFCILCAVVLTYPDAGGLSDRSSVLSLHNRWLDLLQKYSVSRYPDNRRRCGRILLRLLSLRSVSARAADKFLSCAVDVDVKMTDIVQEMIS